MRERCWLHVLPHSTGLEAALGRLRELESDLQQQEARLTDVQEENLELSTEVRVSGGKGEGVRCRAHSSIMHAPAPG